jgi:hypothetical protein
MPSYLSDKNLLILKELIFDPELLDKINRFLVDLSINTKYFRNSEIKFIDNPFRTIQRLQRIPSDPNKTDHLWLNET